MESLLRAQLCSLPAPTCTTPVSPAGTASSESVPLPAGSHQAAEACLVCVSCDAANSGALGCMHARSGGLSIIDDLSFGYGSNLDSVATISAPGRVIELKFEPGSQRQTQRLIYKETGGSGPSTTCRRP